MIALGLGLPILALIICSLSSSEEYTPHPAGSLNFMKHFYAAMIS
jgi:hypothetical protein